MSLSLDAILTRWHKLLGLRRQIPLAWHRARLREELHERRLATGRLARLSETSDVLFSISRASYDGFPICRRPTYALLRTGPAYAYMLAKYTSRWAFYRTVALLCGAPNAGAVREVVNPSKHSKLDEVAGRHGIDPMKFRKVGWWLGWVWPRLP